MSVYLIHFDEKLHHAQHYLGFADGDLVEVKKRFDRHKKGNGAKILRKLMQVGIDFRLAKIWIGEDRGFERKLKKTKNAKRFCPFCNNCDQLEILENKASLAVHEEDLPL